MKAFFTMVLATVYATSFAQTERKVPSQIKEVTVFISGAQVTRTATTELKPGQQILVFHGTSPQIQENSIQAESNQNVKILGVSFRVNYLKDLAQTESQNFIQKERARLSALIKEEKSLLQIYEEEESMLKSNNAIGGSVKGIVVEELKSAVDFYRTRLLDIRAHKMEIQKRIETYEKEIAKTNAMQTQLGGAAPQSEGEIVVKVESKSETRALLKISYLVNEASWFPLYDIRAKDIQSPIGITYKASITQQSGENWENVKLTVSSANPTSIGSRPNIMPWYLGFNNRIASDGARGFVGVVRGIATVPASANNVVRGQVFDSNGAPMPGVNIMVKGSSNGTVTDVNGNYTLSIGNSTETLVASFIGYSPQEVMINGQDIVNVQLQEDVTQLQELVVTGYAAQHRRDITGSVSSVSANARVRQTIAATPVVRTTDFEFVVDNLYTINSGGDNQIVDMIEYEVDAQYQYYCAPKLDNDAFLTARLTNWDEYNFMEGQASLFFEGKYIGKTLLDTRNTSDTLTLSLGRDKNVVVTREKVKEFSSSQFVGSNRKSLFAYEIIVRNKKAQVIDIRIQDQLPIPNTREITIDEIQTSQAQKDEAKGILTWNYKIEPGKTQKIDLKYEVKYPKYSNIILE